MPLHRDSGDRQDITEDINNRETVRSVGSFMGWNYIYLYILGYNNLSGYINRFGETL